MRLNDYEQGDKGQGVKDLQTNLRKVGYSIGADGIFGLMTAGAVTHFQRARNVTGDAPGVAGPGTLIALALAISQGWRQTGWGSSPGNSTPAADAPNAGGFSLPFGLTPAKLGLVALIGVAAFVSSRR